MLTIDFSDRVQQQAEKLAVLKNEYERIHDDPADWTVEEVLCLAVGYGIEELQKRWTARLALAKQPEAVA